ncbi:MAG: nickel pincer cofactor biosynthesis protein LarC [Promethearchaeota archaeon]
MESLIIDANNSGISGDMFLAALLELVSNPGSIIDDLKDLKGYLEDINKLNIELVKIERSGIKVNQLNLEINEKKHHRKPIILKNALNKFLDEKNFSESAKKYANDVLESLFKAEAEVHQNLIENIHLHEISSVDTLIDILGVSKALDLIGAFKKDFKVYCGRIPLGGGTIKSVHGILPIPAPATVNIFEGTDLIVYKGPIDSELVTPTGAALLINLKPINMINSPDFKLEKMVSSTGQKEFNNFPNILRLFVCSVVNLDIAEESSFLKEYIEDIAVIETDLDDISGEIIGNFVKIIENENVLDIQIVPSMTKKNRPSQIIKVLCYPKYSFQLIEIMLRELGTLGVRYNTIKRVCIDRKLEQTSIQVKGKDFSLNYKISYMKKANDIIIINVKAEYEDLKRINKATGIPVKDLQVIFQSKVAHLSKDFLHRLKDLKKDI